VCNRGWRNHRQKNKILIKPRSAVSKTFSDELSDCFEGAVDFLARGSGFNGINDDKNRGTIWRPHNGNIARCSVLTGAGFVSNLARWWQAGAKPFVTSRIRIQPSF
jgi:hypothetical protein